jgi:hypothetical protein
MSFGRVLKTLILNTKYLKSALTTAKTHEPLLLLDFDDWQSYRAAPQRMRFAARWLGCPLSDFRLMRHRTARGWHIIVYARRGYVAEPLTVVALQAICGSDWRRETFNLVRARNLAAAPPEWRKVGAWNTLYREKLQHGVTRGVYGQPLKT